jgi:anti-anti-sigma factor
MLRVHVSPCGGPDLVLRVDGEADLATAPVLGRALAAASRDEHARVVLDLASLRFIDAHCLGVISTARCLLGEQDRALVPRSPAPMVRHILTICEMDALIEA